MRWNDIELNTLGDMMNAVSDILDNSITPEQDAAVFMEVYREENEYADENIGYLTGYFSGETAKRARTIFGVQHPIFKEYGVDDPTPSEAFQMGQDIGRKLLTTK